MDRETGPLRNLARGLLLDLQVTCADAWGEGGQPADRIAEVRERVRKKTHYFNGFINLAVIQLVDVKASM